MHPEKMTGLELLQAAIAGKLPRPPMSDTVPMDITEARAGYILGTARADERHINVMGGVHGGFAATILDSATGCAVHSMLEAGVGYGTTDLSVKMFRPVPRGETLVVEGKIINLSRSLGVSEGTLKTADGKLLAHATATCFILRRD